MDTKKATDPVSTREVTESLYRGLRLQVTSEHGNGGFLQPGRARDFRQIIEVSDLLVAGDFPGSFRVHTSDGSAFHVQITRQVP